MSLLILITTFACLEVIFLGSPWIRLTKRSRSSFALIVFYIQVRNYFLLPVMPMTVVSGKSKPMRNGLHTLILRLRMPMDDILF
jgi:hypothetical protein